LKVKGHPQNGSDPLGGAAARSGEGAARTSMSKVAQSHRKMGGV